MKAFPLADLGGYHLQLLLVARQSEEEVFLFSVYAGLAVHRAVMLRIYLVILLVLLTPNTVPTCINSGTQLVFLNCMTGSPWQHRYLRQSTSAWCVYIIAANRTRLHTAGMEVHRHYLVS